MVPAYSEGEVLYRVPKVQNMKLKEILKLKDGLTHIKAAINRENRKRGANMTAIEPV
jgi:hypothetical protein